MARQQDTKAWIRAVAAYMNLSLSDLARNAGLAASTVTRYVNDDSKTLSITERTIDAIVRYSGVAKDTMPGERRLPGFGESEATPYEAHNGDRLPAWVEAGIAAHKGQRNGVEAWVMRGWTLDMLGILPGDVLMIDQNRRARAGDVVLALVTDLATSRTETVMRHYDPPFLTTHSAKMGPQRPEQVDEERVVIMGVEDGILRARH